MLFRGRLTNNHKDNSTFCHGNPRIEEPANGKQISLRQIRILRNLRDFRAHSRQLRSSYKRGLNVDQLSKIIAGKVWLSKINEKNVLVGIYLSEPVLEKKNSVFLSFDTSRLCLNKRVKETRKEAGREPPKHSGKQLCLNSCTKLRYATVLYSSVKPAEWVPLRSYCKLCNVFTHEWLYIWISKHTQRGSSFFVIYQCST